MPISRLTDAIYGEDVPSTARAQTQICISALRRLFAMHGRPDLIITRAKGYALQVEQDVLDVHQFDDRVNRARQDHDLRHSEEAVRHYRSALSLWRAPALVDIDSLAVRAAVGRLDERRISVTEDCIDLELSLGHHRDLVAELVDLVAEHPLRERLRGQLMLALYRSGRQAEALEVYRAGRRSLVDELGIEPNEWLQQLEHGILTADESLRAPTVPRGSAVPAPAASDVDLTGPESSGPAPAAIRPVSIAPGMLPTDISDFTGRNAHITAVQEQLAQAQNDPERLAVPVVAIVGKPGVGKTTLAVHVAHKVAVDFADGQLFADLHGRGTQRIGPMQILERFLRTLGVPGTAMPDGLEERAELYRALLSDRRMLIVLDNVEGESQVLPLLPGHRNSAVLITSQSRLSGIPGVEHVDLDVFDSRQSVELLSRIVGTNRVSAEPAAATALAELCGHLPLALRIAGARMATRLNWGMDQLVERLHNETRRLDELKHGGMAIRASLSLAYDAIDDEAKRLFRLLAVVDFPAFSGWVGAALLDVSLPDAQDLLDELTDAQLVDATGTGFGMQSQYRFHDLIRIFARERLVEEEPVGNRNEALGRVLGGLLFLSSEAHQRIYGGGFLQLKSPAVRWTQPNNIVERIIAPPLPWFERERATILAGVRQAAQAGFVDLCWDLAITAVTLFELRFYLNDWRETHEIALAAVRRSGNRLGQAAVLYSIGALSMTEQRFADARRELESAIVLFRVVDNVQGVALSVRNLAFLDRMSGDFVEASRRYEQALKVFREQGDMVAAAYALHNLAQVRMECGSPEEAKRLLEEALDLSQRCGSRRVEAQVLHRIGSLHLQGGEAGEAAHVFDQALSAARDIGDTVGEAYALHGLGMAQLGAGAFEAASAALEKALDVATIAGEQLVEARVSLGLGELALAQNAPARAVGHLRRALDLFRRIRLPALEARAQALLADASAVAEQEIADSQRQGANDEGAAVTR
ncbi:AfsR/SARP family transcriptional regulator [Rugosimonospora acidiphila]|uniref:AfsR/SARP family transcriptional regulator n=1 Tax=Rugosimonospora acidiphila TaxID=556531 RepID=UPI0031E7195D